MAAFAKFPAAALLAGSLLLGGCPVYDDDDGGCYSDLDCLNGYRCDAYSGACVGDAAATCTRPSDCGATETCDQHGRCRTGDCSFAGVGCVDGYVCSSDSGAWECLRESNGSAGSGGESNGGAGG